MAYGLALHYFPGESLLHRWDARCKSLGILTVTFGLLHAGVEALLLFSFLFAGTFFLSRLPLKSFLNDLKGWIFFLSVIFLVKAVFSPGPRMEELAWLPVSEEGIRSAFLTCWRLGLILGYGVLFSAVTRPRELRDAITWFLKPFPFLPARRIALMVSLTIHFLPMLSDQVAETRMALQSRLGNRRKNPLLRAKVLALPLLRRSLIRADEFAFALAARGYREDLPLHLPKIPPNHWIGLVIPIAVILLAAYIPLEEALHLIHR